ncbi:MAG TPA: glycoside hydrolase family 3 N-terminal domain-containing protein [Acidimicrobiales bacterium]|nr:glycoside hydrolase family 3 N-terminal domain-containing protein [Acidimicrobiales bacterium]
MRGGNGYKAILVMLFAALATAGTFAMPEADPPTAPSEPLSVAARAAATVEDPEPKGKAKAKAKAKGEAPAGTPRHCQPASLHERAARVLVVGLPEVTDPSHSLVAEVLELGVGGILITDDNVESRAQVTALVEDIRRRSRAPLVVSADEESGRVRTFEAILGRTPSARRLATEATPPAVRQRGRELGAALASMGIDLDLAPVADLDAGPWSATIGDRSFSSDPAVASEYALAFAAGLTDGGVRATAKHFPGRGQATGDDHTSRVTSALSMQELTATHLKPFATMVGAGIPVVMMSNVDYAVLDRDLPASLSPAAYRLLRGTGFRGVAMTDSVGMAAVNQRWDMAVAAVKAVAAGGDAVLTSDGSFAKDMVHGLVVAVQRGELSEQRLNEAAARMVALAGADPFPVACQAAVVPTLATAVGASP